MNRFLVFTAISLMSAYAPLWAKNYVELFQTKPDSRHVDVKVRKSLDGNNTTYDVKLQPQDASKVLTLGVAWPIPSVLCNGMALQFADKAIASDKNTAAALLIPDSGCASLTLSFEKVKGYFLYGLIEGKPFVSSSETARSYKRIVDFFYRDLRLLLLVIVVGYIALSLFSKTQGISGYRHQPLERYAIFWGLFLLVSAGVLEILLPWEMVRSEVPRLNSYFSSLAHFGPGVDYIFRRFRKEPPALFKIAILFSIILILPDRTLGLISIGIPVAICTFLATVRSPHVGPYRAYSVLLLVNLITLAGGMGIDSIFLPHFHVVSIFIGLVIANSLLKQIRNIGRITSFISWANGTQVLGGARITLADVIARGMDFIGSTKIHFLLSQDEHIEFFKIQKSKFGPAIVSVETLEKLPPIFASVITSTIPIWLLDENSERAVNLRKGELSEETGCFSIVPIKAGGTNVGAICFSGIVDLNEPEDRLAHERISYLFIKYLETFIETSRGINEAKNNEFLVDEIRKLTDTPSECSFEKVIQDSFTSFLSKLNCEGVFFKSSRDRNAYEPTMSVGLNGSHSAMVSELIVPINNSNEHGPFILAVRNGKSIYVNNISYIGDVLRGRTIKFLEKCNSKSLAILPIKTSPGSGQETNVPFVLMIQSKKISFFNDSLQNILNRYVEIVERYLELKDAERLNMQHREALREFVPDHVAKMFMSGKQTRISAVGFLGCLDIVGSTALLSEFGDEWFRRLANSLVTEFANFGRAKLISMNWDAYYFQSESLTDLYDFFLFCRSRVGGFTDREGQSHKLNFRLCITYGDISQDFCEANGFKRWTVVGPAMASVCKFEQRTKAAGHGIFLDPVAASAGQLEQITLLQKCASDGSVYFRLDVNESKLSAA